MSIIAIILIVLIVLMSFGMIVMNEAELDESKFNKEDEETYTEEEFFG